jgi:hypothetical protein
MTSWYSLNRHFALITPCQCYSYGAFKSCRFSVFSGLARFTETRPELIWPVTAPACSAARLSVIKSLDIYLGTLECQKESRVCVCVVLFLNRVFHGAGLEHACAIFHTTPVRYISACDLTSQY